MKKVLLLLSVLAGPLAWADLFWAGKTVEAVFNDRANWASSSGGPGGAGVPDSTTGVTQFRNYQNGIITFDAAAQVAGRIKVDTKDDKAFVWKASDPSFGLSTSSNEGLRICDDAAKSPVTLQIDSGTYNVTFFRVGRADNSSATLVMNGGLLTAMTDSQIGPVGGTGELVVNGGEVRINANVLYVGEAGEGRLTLNGGQLTMANVDYGVCFCHRNAGATGVVTLNGGVLATPKFRLDYVMSGSKLVFNGGTVKALRNHPDFLKANDNLSCEIAEGGLVLDTDGFDITIAHPLTGVGGIVKKGLGTLTLTGANTFSGAITVEEGKVIDSNGVIYTPGREPDGSVTVLDASSGGDLGMVQLHRATLAGYLANHDFTSYEEDYSAVGTECLETPRSIKVKVGSEMKTYVNLETGKTYADTLGGVSYSFTTESAAPRTLRIETTKGLVANVRDVGSWPTEGGKAMNQGVIFRSGNLDRFIGLTDEQRASSYFSSIGLKSEIDLRIDGSDLPSALKDATVSPAAEGCAYFNCPLNWAGTQISADENGTFTNQIRRVFSILGTEGNLPACFHCQIGTDRTGVTGLLLLGLMGVEEETLYRDYLVSNFANIGGSRSPGVPETFLRYLHRGNCNGGKYQYANNAYGLSVAARCRAYLEMCGVTTQEIANITEALSGETPDEVLARVDAYERANGFRTVSYVPQAGQDAVAIHRFAANGTRILPRTNPTRVGYTFIGWDVEHETDNGDGTATVFAIWDAGDTPDRDPKTFKWDNAAGTNKLIDGGNWYVSVSPSDNRERGTPTIIDEAIFENHAGATLGADESFFARSFQCTRWNEDPAVIDINGGLFKIAERLRVGYTDARAVMNINDGTVDAGYVEVGFWKPAEGCQLNVTGGELITRSSDWAGAIVIGKQAESGKTGVKAEMNVSGGRVTVESGVVRVGFVTLGTPVEEKVSVLNVSGGAMTVPTLEVGEFEAHSGGRVIVSGGELAVAGDFNLANKDDSWGDAFVSGGTLSVGGTLRVGNRANVAHTGFTLTGGMADLGTLSVARQCDATATLAGGTLLANKIERSSSAPEGTKATVAADGVTIVAKDDKDDFITRIDDFRIGANGLTLDDGGHTVRVNSSVNMSGIGGLVKKGAGLVKLDAAYQARGVIDVREGTLRLPANATIYCEGTNVAANATLNLNGATVVVVSKRVVASVWTDAAGDHQAANPQNWTSRVTYTDESGMLVEDLTSELPGISPTSDSSVRIPTELALPVGLDVNTVKDVAYVATRDLSLIRTFGANYDTYAGGCVVANGALKLKNNLNALLHAAVAWYDPSDVDSLTVGEDGFISRIANKGYRGAAMDALPYQAGTGAVLASDELRENGLNVLVFTNNHGYVAASSLARIADGQSRALFAVSARQVMGDFVETETASAEVMAIEFAPKGASTENQTGRTTIDQVAWDDRMLVSAIKDGVLNNELATGGLGANALGQMAVRTFDAKATVTTAAARYRKPDDEMLTRKSRQITYENLIGGENLDVNYGRRAHWSAKSRGRLGEALAYDCDLSEAAMLAVEDYLASKWLGDESAHPFVGVTVLEALTLEGTGSVVDCDGADVTIGRLAGSGALANAKSLSVAKLAFDLTEEGLAPCLSLAVPLDLSATQITVSDDLCATLERGTTLTILETTGTIRLGATRKFVSGGHAYAIRAVRSETGMRLELGYDSGLALIIR